MEIKIVTIITICCIVVIMITGIIRDVNVDKKIDNTEYIIDSLKNEINYKDSIYSNVVSKCEYDSIYDLYKTYNYLYDKELLESEELVDSLNTEITILSIKLERIREYNRIAGQGNNIIFLRGWINRVLNE